MILNTSETFTDIPVFNGQVYKTIFTQCPESIQKLVTELLDNTNHTLDEAVIDYRNMLLAPNQTTATYRFWHYDNYKTLEPNASDIFYLMHNGPPGTETQFSLLKPSNPLNLIEQERATSGPKYIVPCNKLFRYTAQDLHRAQPAIVSGRREFIRIQFSNTFILNKVQYETL